MLYELTLYFPGGSYHAIVKGILVHENFIHATQVGECTEMTYNGEPIYTKCESRDCYVAGTYVLKEFLGNMKEQEV